MRLITKLEEAKNKIRYFETLNEKGWNGDNAEPISQIVIDKALSLIEQLSPLPLGISATGRNTIQFEWSKQDLYLEMEIYEGKIELFNQFEYKEKITTIGDD
jgi:hypothetical protein